MMSERLAVMVAERSLGIGSSMTTPEQSPGTDESKPEAGPQGRDHKRTTVRFTDEEYERIAQEARLSEKSLPALLKASHFSGRKLKLLFEKSEAHVICAELRRIGNNVNQIAKRVNGGALEGWYSEFSEVSRQLSEMWRMIGSVYGLR